jgi:HEXXH motif-containing protein
MSTEVHRISGPAFAALARGGGGAAASRRLVAAQRSKHILLLRRVVDLAQATGHAEASVAREAYQQLAAVQDKRPRAVDAVIQYPAVGAWARQTVDDLGSGDVAGNARPGWLSALAAAAVVRSRLPGTATAPAVDGMVMLPSLGRASAVAGQVHVRRAGAAVDGTHLPADPGCDAVGWQGLRRLSAQARGKRLDLVIDDLDPYRAPGMASAGGRLPAGEPARWQSVLDGTWDLLVRCHGTVAEEVSAIVRVLTPLQPPTGDQVSATSRDAFGAVLLSSPVDACSLAVTLTHEVQHAKLSALLDIVPMTLPDDGRRFYAPWREDPRPVSGLLQGAYAFLGVAGFWLRHSHQYADEEAALAEFARWLGAVRLVIDTLASSGQLTGPGETFVSGMDQTLRRWEARPVPQAALRAAGLASEEHRERWRRHHGDIPVPAF